MVVAERGAAGSGTSSGECVSLRVNLLSRFHASGYQSLRVYANYEYLRQSPLLLAFGAVAGGVCGAVGGLVSGICRTSFAGVSDPEDRAV
jgi:hypothetical protein